MPGLEGVLRQRAPAGDVREQHVVGRLLVGQQAPDGPVLHVLHRMRPDHAGQPFGDQLLGDAVLERVEALDLPGFDGEGPAPLLEPLVEERARFVAVLQGRPDGCPFLGQLAVAGHAPFMGALGHSSQRSPDFGMAVLGGGAVHIPSKAAEAPSWPGHRHTGGRRHTRRLSPDHTAGGWKALPRAGTIMPDFRRPHSVRPGSSRKPRRMVTPGSEAGRGSRPGGRKLRPDFHTLASKGPDGHRPGAVSARTPGQSGERTAPGRARRAAGT